MKLVPAGVTGSEAGEGDPATITNTITITFSLFYLYLNIPIPYNLGRNSVDQPVRE